MRVLILFLFLVAFYSCKVNKKDSDSSSVDIPVMLTPSPDIDPFVIGYGQRA
jgi:hypothetical protein